MFNINDVVHWVKITVHTKMGGDLLESYHWSGYRYETRLKWDWYFKYRAALCQVKNPKAHINLAWGNEPAVGKTKELILRDKVTSKKSKITEMKNKINRAVLNYSSLYPIEDDILYQRALCKLHKLEEELIILQNSK